MSSETYLLLLTTHYRKNQKHKKINCVPTRGAITDIYSYIDSCMLITANHFFLQ
jgi:hypothetical protein